MKLTCQFRRFLARYGFDLMLTPGPSPGTFLLQFNLISIQCLQFFFNGNTLSSVD